MGCRRATRSRRLLQREPSPSTRWSAGGRQYFLLPASVSRLCCPCCGTWHEGDRNHHRRPIWLFRSSRRHGERAFDREIAELVDRGKGSIHDVRVLGQAEPGDEGSYDAAGRIDVEMLKAHLPFADYDFYLCGPASFMQSVYDGLRGLNIVDERLHAEAFRPVGCDARPASGTCRPAGCHCACPRHLHAVGKRGPLENRRRLIAGSRRAAQPEPQHTVAGQAIAVIAEPGSSRAVLAISRSPAIRSRETMCCSVARCLPREATCILIYSSASAWPLACPPAAKVSVGLHVRRRYPKKSSDCHFEMMIGIPA